MNSNFVPFAIDALKAMYEHNSKTYTNVGRTDVGPEPLTAEKVASDLRTIYEEIVKMDP